MNPSHRQWCAVRTLGSVCLLVAAALTSARLEQFLDIGGVTSSTFHQAVLAMRLAFVVAGSWFLLRRPRVNWPGLAIGAATMALTILIGGLCVQKIARVTPIVSGWRSYAPKYERNELLFRGRPICYDGADFVVVLLGDSQVEATTLPFEQMPEQRLEHHLRKSHPRARVFSVGARGYGQDQQLLVLREYFARFRADLVVLWQTPGNDICNNLFPTHMPANGAPKPTFRLVDGKLAGPSEPMGQPIPQSPIKLVALCQRTLAPERYYRRDDHWERYLPRPYSALPAWEGEVNHAWQRVWDVEKVRSENLDNEKTGWAMELVPPSPRMCYGIELTRRLLAEIRTTARSHGSEFVVFRAALPEDAAADGGEEVYDFRGKYYRASKRQMELNINAVNRDVGALAIPVKMKDWRISPVDAHLNIAANDQVMGDLAAALRPTIARLAAREEETCRDARCTKAGKCRLTSR
ncbi:MAG: hypothetical protein AB1705_09115 [Verrucomicrobiota bacterium]